jgi:hypothetical protein
VSDGIPDDADLSPAARQRRAEIGAVIGQGRFESAGVEFDERYDASAAIWYEPGQLDTEESWQSDRYEDDDAAIRALELIATEVAPALGWKPAPADSAEPTESAAALTGAAELAGA